MIDGPFGSPKLGGGFRGKSPSESRFPPCIRKVDEMGSWLVPPIVIPVLIVIMVVVYGLYRAYS